MVFSCAVAHHRVLRWPPALDESTRDGRVLSHITAYCRVPAVDLADGLSRDRCRLRGFHRQGRQFRANRGAFQRVLHRPALRRR